MRCVASLVAYTKLPSLELRVSFYLIIRGKHISSIFKTLENKTTPLSCLLFKYPNQPIKGDEVSVYMHCIRVKVSSKLLWLFLLLSFPLT